MTEEYLLRSKVEGHALEEGASRLEEASFVDAPERLLQQLFDLLLRSISLAHLNHRARKVEEGALQILTRQRSSVEP